MRINCPNCGLRDHSEFSYLGDAGVRRPSDDEANMAVWSAFVFGRENPRGDHREHWQHSSGCRAILKVIRDTSTHKISDERVEGEWG